jgi:NAD(P)H-dependent flavin oxidoreductase YrpB (nitropropane dioxygenase family)
MVLGAAGANVGTRFLAKEEAAVDPRWKQRILDVESKEAVRFEASGAILPPPERGHDAVPRVIRTDFVPTWEGRKEEAGPDAERLRRRS